MLMISSLLLLRMLRGFLLRAMHVSYVMGLKSPICGGTLLFGPPWKWGGGLFCASAGAIVNGSAMTARSNFLST
jgi:hypothetical protein